MSTTSQIESQIEAFVEHFRNSAVLFGHDSDSDSSSGCWEQEDPAGATGQHLTVCKKNDAAQQTNDFSVSIYANHTAPVNQNLLDDFGAVDEDEAMEDSGVGAPLLMIEDVSELLKGKYAIITGGRTEEGHPIITFPDSGTFCSLSDEDYKKLMLYLTSVPSMHEADLGFVLVVDRRNDKWSAVKTVLLKISGFFPGLIQEVFVLRPLGFFQKAISEVSNKFFKEEFKFRLAVCGGAEELHEHVSPSQLTEDLGGSIAYNHTEWMEQRVAVEKFSNNLQDISSSLRTMTVRLQETEFPNEVESTAELLESQGKEYKALKEEIQNASRHGESLLMCIRSSPPHSMEPSTVHLYPNRLSNVTAIERLLVQLEETEKGFETFWWDHERKLRQCLELRKFEAEFKELQASLASSRREVWQMPETGDSVAQIDLLLTQMHRFKLIIEEDVVRCEGVCGAGQGLIGRQHYAVDSIAPKCLELDRMARELKEEVDRRLDTLGKHRDLQQRIEKANKWCTRGVDLLASQQMEKCASPAVNEACLKELEDFLRSAREFKLSDPREFHSIFKDTMTPETRALVQQVLKRIEDVQTMCEKRSSNLQKLLTSHSQRPVHAVIPEPAVPLPTNAATNNTNAAPPHKSPDAERKHTRKVKTGPKMQIEVYLGDTNKSPAQQGNSSLHKSNTDSTQDKRGHIMAELIETEKVYVRELHSILKGYKGELDNPSMRDLVPSILFGKADVLFGNMEDIHSFHSKIFLQELEGCSPEMVGRCFIQRSDTFHKLYSIYCINKPKSEAFRRQCGDDNPFFKECQRRLGHKLPLGAYLLKPVQRITKYQLLLRDLQKSCEEPFLAGELQQAVDTMLDVLKYVNDSMHQIAITGFHGSLADYGRLLLQGPFNVLMERKRDRIRDLKFKPSQRYIFLYEQLVLFTKKSGRDDNPTYAFKNALKTSQIGLTENVKGLRGDRRKFELWLHGRTQVFIIQASTNQIKDTWVKEIKKVLLQQFELMKDENIRQYTDKYQKQLVAVNGTNKHPSVALKKSRNAMGSLSWDNCPAVPNNNNTSGLTLGVGGARDRSSEFSRRATLPALRSGYHHHHSQSALHSSSRGMGDPLLECATCTENLEDGWSTDEALSGSDEDEDNGDIFLDHVEIGGKFSVLGDYQAVDVGEATLQEGQTVEVQKVGCAGWWFIRIVETGQQGWVPASYLGPVGKRGSNTPSVSSQESACGSLRHAVSRSSMLSSVSNASLETSTVP